jgi:hypothetical protein
MNKTSIIRDTAEKALAGENSRAAHLVSQAEKLTAVIIIVMGFQVLSASNVLGSGSPWAERVCYLALAVLGLSLFVAFFSIQSRAYADYPRGNKLWETLKPGTVSEDAAQEAIIQVLLRNREENAKLNDAKTRALSICGWLLFAGFLLGIGSQLLAPLAVISPPQ